MELRLLHYFLAIAEEGSINRAAERLRVSQPSLSRQLQALENQLGHRLVQRTARGATLTATGEALVQHARKIVALEAATAEVVAGARPVREVVVLGVPPGTPTDWLLRLVRTLKEGEAQCEPSLVETSSSTQLRMLREGRVDLAMVHQKPPAEYASWELREEPFGVAIRPGTALAREPSVGLEALDRLRVLVHSREQVPTQHDALIGAAMDAGVQPQWHFAKFVEHALPAAEAIDADAALISNHTATRQMPDWPWRRIEGLPLAMTTWLVRQRQTRSVVRTAAQAILDSARTQD